MELAEILILIIIAASLGLLPAYIAKSRGRNFYAWWAYGAFVFPVAIIHTIILGSVPYLVCPYCGIKTRPPHCRRCGYEFIDFS